MNLVQQLFGDALGRDKAASAAGLPGTPAEYQAALGSSGTKVLALQPGEAVQAMSALFRKGISKWSAPAVAVARAVTPAAYRPPC